MNAAGERHFAWTLTRMVIDHCREHAPEVSISALLALTGETRDVSVLCDDAFWTPYQQFWRLLEAAAEVLGPNDWLIHSRFKDSYESFPELCHFVVGLDSLLPALFGFGKITTVEERCVPRGEDCPVRLPGRHLGEPVRTSARSESLVDDVRVALLCSGQGNLIARPLEPIALRATVAEQSCAIMTGSVA